MSSGHPNIMSFLAKCSICAFLELQGGIRHELVSWECACRTKTKPVGSADGSDLMSALSDTAHTQAALQGTPSVGAEPLLQLLKKFGRSGDVKTSITVGEPYADTLACASIGLTCAAHVVGADLLCEQQLCA